MGQINFYVPANIEEKIKTSAKKKRQSVSEFVAEVIKREMGLRSGWPEGYFQEVIGSWEGDFPELVNLPTEERDWPE